MHRLPETTPFEFSIVIVTYNNVDTIVKCLKSLAGALAGYNSQIFVIDNFSTDGTAGALKAFAKKRRLFSHLVIDFNTENLGYTKAVNQGLHKARGNFILILNPDVILFASTLRLLHHKLEDDESIGIVAPQLLNTDGTIQPSCRYFPRKVDVVFKVLSLDRLFPDIFGFRRWYMPDFDFNSSRDVDQPQGAFLLVRKEVVDLVGFFDETFFMFFSDVDYCYRVRQSGWRIHFCAEASALHQQGASVFQFRPRMIVSSHRAFVQYFSKYDTCRGGRLATKGIEFLLLLATLPRLIVQQIAGR
jgi:GT2 family glycosyltransferase